MSNPAGESNGEILRLDFDRRLMLDFRGSVVTSDAGLLAFLDNRRPQVPFGFTEGFKKATREAIAGQDQLL